MNTHQFAVKNLIYIYLSFCVFKYYFLLIYVA